MRQCDATGVNVNLLWFHLVQAHQYIFLIVTLVEPVEHIVVPGKLLSLDSLLPPKHGLERFFLPLGLDRQRVRIRSHLLEMNPDASARGMMFK